MSLQDVAFILFLAIVACVIYSGKARDRRRRRTQHELVSEREKRARIRDEEDALRAKSMRDILSVARERARLAFPELMTADEALCIDPTNISLEPMRSRVDEIAISRALEEIANDESVATYSERQILKLEPDIDFPDGAPSLELGAPARIIDCGSAGSIELYTSEQVDIARQDADWTQYIYQVEAYAGAPELGRQIIQLSSAPARSGHISRSSWMTFLQCVPSEVNCVTFSCHSLENQWPIRLNIRRS